MLSVGIPLGRLAFECAAHAATRSTHKTVVGGNATSACEGCVSTIDNLTMFFGLEVGIDRIGVSCTNKFGRLDGVEVTQKGLKFNSKRLCDRWCVCA